MSALGTLTLLSPKSSANMSIGSGGIPELTKEEVSATLGLVHRHIARYAYLKWVYCSEDAYRPEWQKDFTYVKEHIQTVIGVRFPNTAYRRVIDLAHIALLEDLSDRGGCPTCNGVGQIKNQDAFHSCDTCNGTGRFRMTIADKAEYCGINISAWNKSGKPKVAYVHDDLLAGWQKALHRMVVKHLRPG